MISSQQIIDARGPRNEVSADRPYAYFVEQEYSRAGCDEAVATVFLTNRECPFKCLMCDLWKNTLEESVQPGQIVKQIRFALEQLEPARHIKLYNSGNFFDRKAVPEFDVQECAGLVGGFDTVIVENHPRFCDERCVRFRDALGTDLDVAIGLETAHEGALERLNKQMTVDLFAERVRFLRSNGIHVRSFILIRPPFLTEAESLEWAIRSVEFAFDCGVECAPLIPVRAGNGIMDQLQASGEWAPPTVETVETAFETALRLGRGRVFLDLWDSHLWLKCHECSEQRLARLDLMNHTQTIPAPVDCRCGDGP